jgi:high frequency lysogenization protein
MSINQKIIDQVIALAGLAQSVRIVQHIAWKGKTNQTDFKAVVASLLRIDAKSAIAVYGGSFEVSTGLRLLKQQLDTTNDNKDPEFVGIIINLLSLQKRLSSNTKIMDQLSSYIAKLSARHSDQNFYQDDELFNQLLQNCSEAYKETLSKLSNRIQVKGEPKFLKPQENQIQVRAALLCAIRSAFLWRQSGGSRWHFLFKKKTILEAADYLLNNPQKQ